MNSQNNKGKMLYSAAKWILLILILSGIILFNKKMNRERLIEIHIEKEKENGVKGLNQALYKYNSESPIGKFIVTDYQYLWILPEISQTFMDGQIQDLDPSNKIFTDETVGFLLWTPSPDNSKTMPAFIEEGIKTGKYTEIFNYEGYRFIKIR
jgi:hypothetical protein